MFLVPDGQLLSFRCSYHDALLVKTLNDAIHISKDSGLTMGMAVCSVGV